MLCTGGVRPALLIDSSTIDPPTARELDAAVASSSLHQDSRPCSGCSAAHPALIDAPVSGGITGASKATLTFMVSAVTQTLCIDCTHANPDPLLLPVKYNTPGLCRFMLLLH